MNEMNNGINLGEYKPLGEIVFEYLRTSILNGDLKPGERLMEIALAKQLGVSRTPVREAIRKLEKEKFVEMIPRKGAIVANLTTEDILDVLEIRLVLEGFASSMAANRMTDDEMKSLKKSMEKFNNCVTDGDRKGMIDSDDEFHSKIYESTKNSKLMDIVKDLHDQYQRFRLTYYREFDNYDEIQEWHKKIYEAILAKDSELAKDYSESHVKSVRNRVIAWQEKDKQTKLKRK